MNSNIQKLCKLIDTLGIEIQANPDDAWLGRSLELANALKQTVEYLENNHIPFDILTLDNLDNIFSLSSMQNLAFNHNGIYGDDFASTVEPLKNILEKLPHFDPNSIDQKQITVEQYGFIFAQLHNALGEILCEPF